MNLLEVSQTSGKNKKLSLFFHPVSRREGKIFDIFSMYLKNYRCWPMGLEECIFLRKNTGIYRIISEVSAL